MAQFEAVYEGQVREVYIVEAETMAEAEEAWPDGWLASSEVYDGDVVSIEEVTD
jgi:hypothetical protein